MHLCCTGSYVIPPLNFILQVTSETLNLGKTKGNKTKQHNCKKQSDQREIPEGNSKLIARQLSIEEVSCQQSAHKLVCTSQLLSQGSFPGANLFLSIDVGTGNVPGNTSKDEDIYKLLPSAQEAKVCCVGKPCIRAKTGCLVIFLPSTPVASKPSHSNSCFRFLSNKMVQTWGEAHAPFLTDFALHTHIIPSWTFAFPHITMNRDFSFFWEEENLCFLLFSVQ